MGTTKIAAAPVFFLAVVLLAPLLPLFSSLACVRACVYEYVCVRKGCALKIFFLAFPLRGRLGRPEVPFRIAVAPDFFPDRARSYSSVIHVD